jgi:hypothetical protein
VAVGKLKAVVLHFQGGPEPFEHAKTEARRD